MEDFLSVFCARPRGGFPCSPRLPGPPPPAPRTTIYSLQCPYLERGLNGDCWFFLDDLLSVMSGLDVRMKLCSAQPPRSTAWLACHLVVRQHMPPGSGRHRRTQTSRIRASVEGRAHAGHLPFVKGPAVGHRTPRAHTLTACRTPQHPLQPRAPVRSAWGPRGILCRSAALAAS